MEFLFEFILELILDGSLEASKNQRIPKFIRYPLIGIIVLFFVMVIGLIMMAGILSLKENVIVGLFFIIIGLVIFIMSIIKFRKVYLLKK